MLKPFTRHLRSYQPVQIISDTPRSDLFWCGAGWASFALIALGAAMIF